MSFSVAALRREYKIRQWADIISNYQYIAVLQLTGSTSWGRTNMKWRILAAVSDPSGAISAKYAPPQHAREGALRTRFVGLADLFRGAPCAVIYGERAGDVVTAVTRASELLHGAELIGGRFGEEAVHATTWKEAIESEGEIAEFTRLVQIIAQGPALIRSMNAAAPGLLAAIDNASGQKRLTRVLDKIGETSNNAQAAQAG